MGRIAVGWQAGDCDHADRVPIVAKILKCGNMPEVAFGPRWGGGRYQALFGYGRAKPGLTLNA
jgi:hypothetical protein